MYCKHCGKEISDDSKVCPECGFNLEDEGTAAASSKRKDTAFKIAVISLLALALVGIILIFIGLKQETTGSISSTPEANPAATQAAEKPVDEHLFTVDLTFPATMFQDEDMSQFDPETYAKEAGFISAKLNDDGSITVKMTKAKHKELLDEVSADMEKSFSELVEGKDTPYIKGITHNKDFSLVTVKVIRSDYERAFDVSPLMLGMSSLLYQTLIEMEPHVEVVIRDDRTNDVIRSVIYPDAFDNYNDSVDSFNDYSSQETEPAVIPGNQVLLDDYGVKVTYTGLTTEKYMDDKVVFMVKIENNLGDEISVHADSVSINGKMCEMAFSGNCDVAPGKYTEGCFYLDGNINDIRDISLKLEVRYGDERDYDLVCETDYITVTP